MTDEFTSPLTFDYTGRSPGFDPTDMDIHELAKQLSDTVHADVLNTRMQDAVDAHRERLEKELMGAWRAGYDYLHVYDNMPAREDVGRGKFEITQGVIPSNREEPPKSRGCVYRYTYDLTSVPDHVLRAAARGELEEYKRVKVHGDE